MAGNPISMRISTTANKDFDCGSEETILDAAERSGVMFEHSCRSGRCNSCKSKVISGDSTPALIELGLTDDERSEGWILTCARRALTDMVLDIEDLGDIRLPKPRIYPCKIHAMEKLSRDVLRVLLRIPPNSHFDFCPGQHVEICYGKSKRFYSVANGLGQDNIIELQIKEVEGGELSEYWFNEASESDLLRLRGPLGTFFLRDYSNKDIIFLATGTGIAPIKSIIESIAMGQNSEQPKSITLYWGGRYLSDLYLDKLDSNFPHQMIKVLSRGDSNWRGERGYVQDVALKREACLDDCQVYACGSPEMIAGARSTLIAGGLSPHSFYSDAFVAS